jgi:antitoxin (DNA-binding transcriptional repressor) of toxin-antitoxin stability system
MKFVTARDLRLKPGEVWKRLLKEQELVVTLNGRPVALLTRTAEESLEDDLLALRRARAQAAVERMQRAAGASGLDKLPDREIEKVIAGTRRTRRR